MKESVKKLVNIWCQSKGVDNKDTINELKINALAIMRKENVKRNIRTRKAIYKMLTSEKIF